MTTGLPNGPVTVPSLPSGNGSLWVAPPNSQPAPTTTLQYVDPIRTAAALRAAAAKKALDNYSATLYELAAYELTREAGRHGLTSRVQPSNPRSFIKPPVVPPSRVRADIPEDLERVVLRCLAKDPAERYPDAEGLERALCQCACAGDWHRDRAARWWRAADLGTQERGEESRLTSVA